MEYDSETDHQSSQNDNNDEHTETSSQVVSSLSFDGGCFVSAQAIMCNGGGGDDPLMYMSAAAFDSDMDVSEDEDDDDEDDGHSSMLSNASLRSKAYAGGSAVTPPRSQNSNRNNQSSSKSTGQTSYYEREITLQRHPAATRAALMIRGGSVVSVTDNELATGKETCWGFHRYFGVRGLH